MGQARLLTRPCFVGRPCNAKVGNKYRRAIPNPRAVPKARGASREERAARHSILSGALLPQSDNDCFEIGPTGGRARVASEDGQFAGTGRKAELFGGRRKWLSLTALS
jgi:hypothetical protein